MDQKISQATEQFSKTYSDLAELQEEISSILSQEEERLVTLNDNELKRIMGTFSKLPQYQDKILEIARMMAAIDKRNQQLKRRATYVEEKAKEQQKEQQKEAR